MPVASPRLPVPLAAPFALLPGTLHSRLLAAVLNQVLKLPLRDGALDFLGKRCVAIDVQDAGVVWRLTVKNDKLCMADAGALPDLTIAATAYDFISLAGREVDPDTLVFQRRLFMQGDTELGLQLKNLLDSLDAEALPAFGALVSLLEKITPLFRRVFA